MAHADSAAPRQVDLARAQDFRLGPLQVRPSICQVLTGDRVIDLQPKVMQVLVVLAEAQDRSVSREELLAACWGEVVVGDDSIHRCIARLRRLSEQEAPGAFTITTQARVGYRLFIEDPVPDAAAGDAAPPFAPRSVRPGGSRRKADRRLGRPAALVAIAAAAAVALLAPVVLAPAPSPYRMAVRDFAVSGDAADLGASLPDRIAAAANDRQLPVVSRERSRRGDLDGAHYVVGGEIRRMGPLVRVDVRLDDAKSGLSLWTHTFSRPASDSDAMQDQVAGKVADVMDLTRRWLGPDDRRTKPEVVAALIQATDAMRGGRATLIETREAFRRLRDLAPDTSWAHSAFAMSSAMAAGAEPPETAARWRSEARQEAQRAIALDPKNSEGYKVLGYLTPDTDLVQRQAWYAKGLAADPNDGNLCNFNGHLLLDAGRTQDGLQWLDRALKLDPLSAPKTQSLIRALTIAGRFDEAAAMFPRVQRLWPDEAPIQRLIVMRTLVYASPAEASAALDRMQASAHALPPDAAAAWRQYEKARAGDADSADAARRLTALASAAGEQDIDSLIAALASLDDTDDAFRIIGQSRADAWSSSTLFEPATASLRKDPRFAAVAEQAGLSRYWAKTGHRPDVCAADASLVPCRG